MKIIKVLLPKLGLFPLDYICHENPQPRRGDIVQTIFRNKICPAIVWETDITNSSYKLKAIEPITEYRANISKATLDLIEIASRYYLAPLGTIAKLSIPVDPFASPIKYLEQEIPESFNLSDLDEQQINALHAIESSDKPIILKGVTGSGKTEIYFHAIASAIKSGKQALILLPEIGLLTQIAKRFKERFGFDIAIWHSSITAAKKKRIFRGIISGSIKVVLGTRSALFLPFKELDIIVIDEEHDSSYKQNDAIAYNARDMAVLRAKLEGCKLVLASATPSIETLQNCIDNKYRMIEINQRYNSYSMPKVEIIDMRSENLASGNWISESLKCAISTNLLSKEQSLLFLNRRGYAPLMLCKTCGHRFECKNCSASMVFHKKLSKLECHHCGFSRKVLNSCEECDSTELTLSGPGIERLEEETKQLFPNAKIKVLSKEQATKNDELEQILLDMEQNNIDILIGTQIITKGYHFPNLTLVGIIDADMGLFGGDFRSSERTFQLLSQVGGRAGRSHKDGRVLIQTYNPDNKVTQSLAEANHKNFINYEIEARKESGMPPFSRMASISFTGTNPEYTARIAKDVYKLAPSSSAKLLGPAEAVMHKLAGKYRYKILILAEKNFNIQKYISTWLESAKTVSSIHIKIDIDPQHFL